MSASDFLTLTLRLGRDQEAALAEVLTCHETLGAHLNEVSADRPVPDQVGLDATIYLDSSQAGGLPALLEDLNRLVGEPGAKVGAIEGRDWLEAYRLAVVPFPLGRTWWIDPHPRAPSPAPEGRMRLAIEPRMAFGTGSHQSTHLVLLELEDHPPTGLSVLDVGTGSGILALAALRLEALDVVGFDIDAQAVMVARQIVGDQDFKALPSYFAGPIGAIGRGNFDLVLCNMIALHFMPLVDDLSRVMAERGTAVFSGVLETELDGVSAALEKSGLRIESVRRLDEWVALRAFRG